jgi:hypothetical protein
MVKNYKIFVAMAILLLTLQYLCVNFTPVASAQEVETVQQKGLAITSNVLGVDTSKCNVTVEDHPAAIDNAFLGLLPQESVIYNFSYGRNSQRILYSFVNNNLELLQVLDDSQQTTNLRTVPNATYFNTKGATRFLDNYYEYSGNTLYKTLKATLNGAEGYENQTVVLGNTKLELTSFSDGSTNFKWYYTANGASSPYTKFVALCFKNAQLTAFVDNWNIYNVGSTSVNLSKEKAIAIAIDTARAYADNMSLQTFGFKDQNINESSIQWASLILDTSINADLARGKDTLELYPDWRVGVQLDQWYGEMYGIEVDIWADTCQVRSVQTAYSALTPAENATLSKAEIDQTSSADPTLSTLIPVSVISLVMAGVILLWIMQKRSLHFNTSLKNPSRIVSIFLCTILLTSFFYIAIGTASATTRGAEVWGSTSAGAYDTNYPPQNNWRKSAGEISNQSYTATYIASYFSQNGYSGNSNINHQGTSSTTTQISSDIQSLVSSKDYLFVVDFDHGVGGYPGQAGLSAPSGETHYMFEDNTGTVIGTSSNHYTDWNHAIYDMQIYNWVTWGKVPFAFINTCLSADTTYFGQGLLSAQYPYPQRAIGMPYAWTHRIVESPYTSGFTINQDMSTNGYNYPDWASQVYIGFPYGSASLSQGIPFNGGGGNPYYYWVVSFFYNALCTSNTVNQALNTASLQFMGSNFGSCPLSTGFDANWWNFNATPGCTMAIYGNGNIRLQQYTEPSNVASIPSINGITSGGVNLSTGPFNAYATNPYGNDIQYRFNWGDGTNTTTGYYSDGQSVLGIYHTWTSTGTYSVTVQAKTATSDWSSCSSAIQVNVGSQGNWITFTAYDVFMSQISANVYINGNYAGTTPTSILVPYGASLTFDEYAYVPSLNEYEPLFCTSGDGTTYIDLYYYR